jgi:hypothetical protein
VKFLDAGTKSLTTDPGLAKLKALYELAQQVRHIGLDKVQFFTVPIATYAPDPNRLALGPGSKKLFRELKNDHVLSPQFTSDAAKASQGKPHHHESAEQKSEAETNGLCA